MNLLLAALIFMQDRTAEETFRKIEDSILKAKSVSMEFKCVINAKTISMEVAGSVALREGNKYRETSVQKTAKGDIETIHIADGRTLYVKQPGLAAERLAVPDKFSERLGLLIARFGAMGFIGDVVMRGWSKEATADVEASMQLSEFTYVPPINGVQAIRFKVTGKEGKTPFLTTLGYDPETMALKFRRLETATLPAKTLTLETYTDFTLNADIPDEKFKLPEEKK